jgi:hypothetical protein
MRARSPIGVSDRTSLATPSCEPDFESLNCSRPVKYPCLLSCRISVLRHHMTSNRIAEKSIGNLRYLVEKEKHR